MNLTRSREIRLIILAAAGTSFDATASFGSNHGANCGKHKDVTLSPRCGTSHVSRRITGRRLACMPRSRQHGGTGSTRCVALRQARRGRLKPARFSPRVHARSERTKERRAFTANGYCYNWSCLHDSSLESRVKTASTTRASAAMRFFGYLYIWTLASGFTDIFYLP